VPAAGPVATAVEHTVKPPLDPPSPFFDQDGVHEIYREWHRVLAEYDGDRMLVAEAWVEPAERLARYVRKDEMQQAFNFDFLLAGWDAERMAVAIESSLDAAGSVEAPSTWVLSNHDTVRHPSRFGLADPTTFPKGIAAEDEQPDAVLGLARARAASMVSFALPGSAYLYQGEELGLPEHTSLPADARQDPSFFRTKGVERGRDGCRVPLPWKSGAPGFGFSEGASSGTAGAAAAGGGPAAPWLPQPEAFGELAADVQAGVEGSTLELYRSVLAFRRSHRLGSGTFQWAEEHRTDPSWFRTGEPGRDGCRVPMPWGGQLPPFEFGPGSGQPWLPQPADWSKLTVAVQEGDADSTLSFYRAALRLRRDFATTAGDEVELLDLGTDVLAFRRGPVTVVLNCGGTPVALPAGRVLLASGPVTDQLPADTAVWLS
jgi:glycosidase